MEARTEVTRDWGERRRVVYGYGLFVGDNTKFWVCVVRWLNNRMDVFNAIELYLGMVTVVNIMSLLP